MFARVFALLPFVLFVAACEPDCPLNDIPKVPQPPVTPPTTPPTTPPATPPTPPTGPTTVNQCNTGPVQCCNQVQTIDQCTEILQDHNLLGVAGQLGALVGLDCSPLSVIGVGSGCQVSQQPVCCENNQFNGLVNVGCTPINLQL